MSGFRKSGHILGPALSISQTFLQFKHVCHYIAEHYHVVHIITLQYSVLIILYQRLAAIETHAQIHSYQMLLQYLMAHMFNDAACALFIIEGEEEGSKFWGAN